MRRDQTFKFQRALDAFDVAKGKFHTDENAVKTAIETWENGRERSNDDIAITGHVVENGRWFVILLVLCWLALAFVTSHPAGVAAAATTSLTLAAAWCADQSRGWLRGVAVSICITLPAASFGLLLWALR